MNKAPGAKIAAELDPDCHLQVFNKSLKKQTFFWIRQKQLKWYYLERKTATLAHLEHTTSTKQYMQKSLIRDNLAAEVEGVNCESFRAGRSTTNSLKIVKQTCRTQTKSGAS